MEEPLAFVFFCLFLILILAIPPALLGRRLAQGKVKGKLKFVGGLNLPENMICKVTCSNDEIVIASSGQEFHLPAEKLVSVSVMKNTEIQRQYVSSAGGALAGAMIAGPLGAIIGGSPSKKNIRLNKRNLVIAYQGETNVGYILFDAEKNPFFVDLIKSRYKHLKSRPSVKVDL